MDFAKKILSFLLLFGLFIAVIAGIFFRQDIYDWWRLRNYHPPARISSLATQTTMTDEGKTLFYVAHPKISDADTFNQQCQVEEFTIVLGCFVTPGNIYLYDVTDKRLAGILEVTAAHEMLHVAYERLDSEQKQTVNRQLEAAFAEVNNERIKKVVAQYRKNDPSSVPNELHSILGTEVKNLPQDLEDYYSQYFSNRQKVVAFSNDYEAEFASRQQRVAAIDEQLAGLKPQIEQNQALISAKQDDIQLQRQQLDNQRSGGDIEAYNSGVPAYNALINEYNALVAETKDLIATYNSLVKERNNLVVEVQDLYESIDSTPELIDS